MSYAEIREAATAMEHAVWRAHLAHALEKHNWIVSAAARDLEVSAQQLAYTLRRVGLGSRIRGRGRPKAPESQQKKRQKNT